MLANNSDSFIIRAETGDGRALRWKGSLATGRVSSRLTERHRNTTVYIKRSGEDVSDLQACPPLRGRQKQSQKDWTISAGGTLRQESAAAGTQGGANCPRRRTARRRITGGAVAGERRRHRRDYTTQAKMSSNAGAGNPGSAQGPSISAFTSMGRSSGTGSSTPERDGERRLPEVLMARYPSGAMVVTSDDLLPTLLDDFPSAPERPSSVSANHASSFAIIPSEDFWLVRRRGNRKGRKGCKIFRGVKQRVCMWM